MNLAMCLFRTASDYWSSFTEFETVFLFCANYPVSRTGAPASNNKKKAVKLLSICSLEKYLFLPVNIRSNFK